MLCIWQFCRRQQTLKSQQQQNKRVQSAYQHQHHGGITCFSMLQNGFCCFCMFQPCSESQWQVRSMVENHQLYTNVLMITADTRKEGGSPFQCRGRGGYVQKRCSCREGRAPLGTSRWVSPRGHTSVAACMGQRFRFCCLTLQVWEGVFYSEKAAATHTARHLMFPATVRRHHLSF